jgi:hypothetical protein
VSAREADQARRPLQRTDDNLLKRRHRVGRRRAPVRPRIRSGPSHHHAAGDLKRCQALIRDPPCLLCSRPSIHAIKITIISSTAESRRVTILRSVAIPRRPKCFLSHVHQAELPYHAINQVITPLCRARNSLAIRHVRNRAELAANIANNQLPVDELMSRCKNLETFLFHETPRRQPGE